MTILTPDQVVYETMKDKIFGLPLHTPTGQAVAYDILEDGYDCLVALDSPILKRGLQPGEFVRIGNGEATWMIQEIRDDDQAVLQLAYSPKLRKTTVHISRLKRTEEQSV